MINVMTNSEKAEEIAGYLLKWTNIIKGYQKRWFLVQNGLLSYYSNPKTVGSRCRGTFDLSHAVLTAPHNQTSFILTEINGRKHHLKALTDEDKIRWIKVLSSVIHKTKLTLDPESDTYFEESPFPTRGLTRASSTGRHRRLFRSRTRSGRKQSSKHGSSPNLPQGNGGCFSEDVSRPTSLNRSVSPNTSADATPQVTHGPYTLSDTESPLLTSNSFANVEKQLLGPNHTAATAAAACSMRRPSASTELFALMELVLSVDTFRKRLDEHTLLVCNNLNAVEQLLSGTVAEKIPVHELVIDSTSNDMKNGPPVDSRQTVARLMAALKEHRTSVKEFHRTCSEALQFLVTNFERWHRRILAEQERCIGLERTVEQLARQHRALEIQFSQCFSCQLDDTCTEFGGRAMRAGTLRKDSYPTRGGTLNRPINSQDLSDEDDLFYDAQSIMSGESAVLNPELCDPTMLGKLLSPLHRAEGVRASATSLRSLEDADESSASDTASEEQAELERRLIEASPHQSSEQIRRASAVDTSSDKPVLPQQQTTVPGRRRRTAIRPSPMVALNLWSIIKNGIGKDLTKIPIPVNFNEPISFLQRAAEDLTYSHLLDEASQTKDPAEQMALVAAFSVSCYATTAIRTGKPFNPLLGETFEFDRSNDSYGWRLVAEQVTHHPPGSAMFCESVRYGWKIWVEFVLVSKFRGKYMSVIPKGTVNLQLPDGSRYTWSKATTVVHNLIVGTLWIDNYGDVLIRNHTNQYSCPLRFIAHSYFTRGPPKQVTGVVQNPAGSPVRLIRGMWDSHIDCEDVDVNGTPSGEPRTLWRALPVDPGAEKMYNFSQFTIELNEPEEGIAPTDSRLRPDQRLMEDGAWDQANEEKRRLEQKQRTKRHRWEQEQAAGSREPLFTPVWFVSRPDPVTGEQSHVYNGTYWDAKSRQDWSACPDIY